MNRRDFLCGGVALLTAAPAGVLGATALTAAEPDVPGKLPLPFLTHPGCYRYCLQLTHQCIYDSNLQDHCDCDCDCEGVVTVKINVIGIERTKVCGLNEWDRPPQWLIDLVAGLKPIEKQTRRIARGQMAQVMRWYSLFVERFGPGVGLKYVSCDDPKRWWLLRIELNQSEEMVPCWMRTSQTAMVSFTE